VRVSQQFDKRASGVAFSEKFKRAFRFTVMEWEAVYVHNTVVAEKVKNDPGGTTKYGIDQRDHPSVDVMNLTLEQAERIYHDGVKSDLSGRHLEGGEWFRIRGDDLIEDWAIALFDCAVNPGLVSIHWAQEIVGIRADGIVGPVSIAAINSAGDDALQVLLTKRDRYYLSRGSWAKDFKEGWLNRNNALRRELGFDPVVWDWEK
jgi:lysozyme family protein